MIPLNGFWNHLTYRPGLAGLREDWVKCFGETGWVALRRDLLVTGEVAASYWCSARRQEFHIRRMADGSYAFISAVSGAIERQGLTEQDVLNFRVNVGVLRDRVARALGIQSDPGRVASLVRAIAIGSWLSTFGISIPLFMILPPTRLLLLQECRRLLSQISGGFLLFTPVNIALETELQQNLKTGRARIFSLSELITCNDEGGFEAAAAWEVVQAAYQREYFADRMVLAPDKYEFRQCGDHWTVRFDDRGTTLKDAVGTRYIAYLLAHPHQKVPAPDLLAFITGESTVRATGSAGAQADRQAIEAARSARPHLCQELDRAKRKGDLAAQARFENDIRVVDDYVLAARGYAGRTREACCDAQKIRRAVSQAIRRTIDSLRKKLPAAALHFDNAINTGSFISYEPDEELVWTL